MKDLETRICRIQRGISAALCSFDDLQTQEWLTEAREDAEALSSEKLFQDARKVICDTVGHITEKKKRDFRYRDRLRKLALLIEDYSAKHLGENRVVIHGSPDYLSKRIERLGNEAATKLLTSRPTRP